MQLTVIKIRTILCSIITLASFQSIAQCAANYNKLDSTFYEDSLFTNKLNCSTKFLFSNSGDSMEVKYVNGKIRTMNLFYPNGSVKWKKDLRVDGSIDNDSIVEFAENGYPQVVTYFGINGKDSMRYDYYVNTYQPKSRTKTVYNGIVTTEYDLTGRITSETYSFSGLHATKYNYNLNGLLQSIFVTSGGQTSSTIFSYYSNGVVRTVQTYTNNQLSGLQITYSKKGKVLSREYYINGVKN